MFIGFFVMSYINEFKYIFVLLEECIMVLVIKFDGIYIDVIFGCGGYLNYILNILGDSG